MQVSEGAQNVTGPAVPEGAEALQSVYGLILEQARDGIVVQDIEARIEWVNPACEDMYGWSLEEMRGRKPQDFILPANERPDREALENFRYDPESPLFRRYQLSRNVRRNGQVFWNQQSFAMLDLGPGAHQKRVVVTCRDVTDQVNAELALRQIQVDLKRSAHHDDLTGLANRKKLEDYLGSKLVTDHIAQGKFGVLVIDIDKFKDINDTLGHGAGDATLKHVARALESHCAPGDLACRTGGDEFLLICLEPGNKAALIERANAVLETLAHPLDWDEQAIRIGASIGACLPERLSDTGEALIQRADQALYSAKARGRGQVVCYTPHLGQVQKAQQELARDLREALVAEQFEIYLQPQLRLSDRRICGCEALVRWRHPRRGLLLPSEFLSAADGLGILADIDYMSMNMALDALAELHAAGFDQMTMAIDVSASILADVNYPGLLDWGLQMRGLRPEHICIEVLETTILDGSGHDIVTAVERLKRLGVRVALDDFGTGYAGLSHMATFEIDAIKLDRSMIARLDSDPRNRVIVRAIIRLCTLLDMQVVAEGVETEGQLDMLRRANCPVIQGFGLARPMRREDLITWMTAHDPLPATKPFRIAPAPVSSPIHSLR
ncbi:Cyclic di-GMP phosphodiesterase Gmr [Roseovarius gaetbuli]|uniref:Cyclic di-GMP phosphodiesterase Gmr n=1 Tax=Roseovarius gaetbuli TaxID=1356575 RepID=A0A1X6ZBH9_9RHOB|nr:EAL domain-containing protein [Roseovarius gaetbuli]SLN46352.1 Cyclic di-GMP phosphodiesterase Gmr [Roseovarius gaetbuli]